MLDSDVGVPRRPSAKLTRTQLFFVDAGQVSPPSDQEFIQSESEDGDEDDIGEEEAEPTACPSDKSESDAEVSTTHTRPSGPRRASAWTDHDDESLRVSLASHNRLRKLRDAPSEDTVTGRVYERKLRRQFQRLNPTPEWATNARKRLRASENPAGLSDSDVDPDLDLAAQDLLTSTRGISAPKKSGVLTQGVISIERLRDANQAAPAEGAIKSVQFHPSPQIPILLTAGADRRLRLFHVCSSYPWSSFSSLIPGRWPDKPPRTNIPCPFSSRHPCRLSSNRFFHSHDRSSPLLLYVRPPIRHLPPFPPGALGHHVCEPGLQHGPLRVQSGR